jgi:hypothetical protein
MLEAVKLNDFGVKRPNLGGKCAKLSFFHLYGGKIKVVVVFLSQIFENRLELVYTSYKCLRFSP